MTHSLFIPAGAAPAPAVWEDPMASETKIQIFRASDAPGLMESGAMTMAPMTDEQRAGMKQMVQAGYMHGDEVKILVNLPGFSLAHAWLKKDYPLLLHSHDSDCLYYVVAGSLAFGTETLGPRDSFFVPAGAAYTYRPGPDGVEVLEFRHQGQFDFQNFAKNPSFYEKAAQTIAANAEGWRAARPPSETA
jgi:mannose-6-phosphate isomerase-like protein (cupin superfamily)